jgi:hexosaminidase
MNTILTACALILAAPAFAATNLAPALIPVPQKLEVGEGSFKLGPGTRILTAAASRATGEFLRSRLGRSTGFALDLGEGAPAKGAILLTTNEARATLGAEGYELSVTPESVVIRAPQQAGLFYGVQTFLQLLPPEILSSNRVENVDWQAPCVRIEDWPRFPWRGFMLDVSRHFQGKEFVMRFIDELALHKMNVFHWHLVDDQGWRLEIKKYPKLTSVGAWRKQPGYTENNGIYGGFYTQDDIREVVAYAAQRHITIVPEIEIPGHSQAAIAAYPELSCSGEPGFVAYFNEFPAAPRTKWPSNSCNVFCASNPKTLEFLQDVLTETMALFPGKYIHIGGDEVGTNYWQHCPRCQALMKSDDLKNYHQLQGWLTKKVEKFLNEHGRQLVGWDEILQGGLAPNATVMSWRNINGGVAAAKAGHTAVMSPAQSLYFNRAQSTAPGQPPAPFRMLITLETAYNYDPIPAALAPGQEQLILGAEACIWTERLNRGDWIETMAFPRLCALAELDWSPKSARDWQDFSRRLDLHRRRLEACGINYSRVHWEPDSGTPVSK